MIRSAVISPCGLYRYELRRVWNPTQDLVAFIGLNPSTADANFDDPTIRRVQDFAVQWGFGGFVMLNLFAFRSPSPRDLRKVTDAVGPDNEATLSRVADEASLLVAAWGKQPWRGVERQAKEVLAWVSPRALHAIATTDDGTPRHPLYLKRDLKPQVWTPYKP